MRAGPDVDEDEGPEVNHRQAIAVDRTFGRLRHEVIHDAEDRRGEEEGHGVVPIPPLHETILDAAEDRVRVGQRGRQAQVVDDVEHRHGDDGRDVEPDRDVEPALLAARQGPEKIHREHHPDAGHRDVDRPDQLGVFLAARKAQRERDRRRDDDELPAPEMQLREKVARQPGLHQALRRVVDAGEHHVADEGEDDRVGVQRPQPAEGQPRQVEVDPPEVELTGDQNADEHAHDAPEDGGEQELADDLVVVVDLDDAGGHG